MEEEVFITGDVVVDDNNTPFIHQIVCREDEDVPAITLHAYGAPTSDDVLRIFRETYDEQTYRYVLEEDGSITTQQW